MKGDMTTTGGNLSCPLLVLDHGVKGRALVGVRGLEGVCLPPCLGPFSG